MGDSYLYLLRRGELIRLNREQNVLHRNYLNWIRGGCMDPALAKRDRESQAVTQFLGIDENTVRSGSYYVSMADMGLSGH